MGGTLKTAKMIQEMLDALETPSKPLTAWETTFYESVSDQFTRHGTLSDLQFENLERIYAEKTD